jgi:hypothetical protein
MRSKWRELLRYAVMLASFLVLGTSALAQQPGSVSRTADNQSDLRRVTELLQQLQSQVQELSVELKDVRAAQASTVSELSELRRKLADSNYQIVQTATTPVPATPGTANYDNVAPAAPTPAAPAPPAKASAASSSSQASSASSPGVQSGTQEHSENVFSTYKEDLQLLNSKVNEQSQTKVESGSKYRVRLSGIMLLNLFSSNGGVDNLDLPEFVTPVAPGSPDSVNAFGGTIRQSQIRLQAFGPDVAGARTSADLKFDFAGGFPQAPNGALLGAARLRTGTVRFDWANTSVVAGQDGLFFAPTSATSAASLAIPALSYSGNLWGWTPQVRVEHRFKVSDSSLISLQAGILDSLSGDIPDAQYERTSTWGEQSAGPAYAGRAQFTHEMFGQEIVLGTGGYFGRQSWGFGRNVDAWAVTSDVSIPLSRRFELSGAFYRGKALGGFGGALGQTALWKGSFVDPATKIYGLDSIGGWAQLKFRVTPKFQVNGAVGQDNPDAAELRAHGGNPYYDNVFLSKNLTPFGNFVYQPRSDMLFSLEYRYLNTTILDAGNKSAHQVNLSVGYLF